MHALELNPGVHTYGLGITDHNVEDTLRHAGAVRQLSQRKGGERCCLCRLQDDLRSATTSDLCLPTARSRQAVLCADNIERCTAALPTPF